VITGTEVFYILLGAAAGGFINGLAGFGTALFALGFFLSVMPPVEAVAVTVVLSVISGLQGVWIVRHTMFDNTPRLLRFLIPGILGVPLGVYSLQLINVTALKLLIAFFLILYGGYFTLRANLPKIEDRTPLIDGTVGFAGGILGGAASLSGALPTMWCSMRGWPKYEIRAVLQPYNVVILAMTMGMLALNGAYHTQTLIHLAVALPTAMVAAQLGILVFARMSDAFFLRMLIVLTFVSGSVLLLRELL
jgi:uncharacterized membrane protein YfcA